MIAVDENNERHLASKSKKQQSLFCPGCHGSVILKMGQQKKAHFAHQNRKNCYGFSEGETNEHLELKKLFFDWCTKWENDRPLQLEANLLSIHQRPDILCGHLAIEIQCSPLTYQKVNERTKGYLANGYSVWWILGSSFFKKDRLTSREKYFCLYNDMLKLHVWKIDWVTKKLWLFYSMEETVVGKVSYEKMSWTFGSESPLQLLATVKGMTVTNKMSLKRISKKWLQKKLYYHHEKYVWLQKQCYLKRKHLLHLSTWIYQDSQFFFYFQEKIFFYRLIYEEVMTEQIGRSDQWKYVIWLQNIEYNKVHWIFPMIDKKMIYRLFYKECQTGFFL